MECVIQNCDTGKYVAPRGSLHSYVPAWSSARVFESKEAAEADRCGNERIIPLTTLIGRMRK